MDQATLRKTFLYDETTGLFYRIKNSVVSNTASGCVSKTHGYVTLVANGSRIRAHRAAYIYINGAIPDGMQIDHINRNRQDNRIENLRLTTQCLNNQNQRIENRVSKSGMIGAHFHKKSGKWMSRITSNKRVIHLGLFDTPEEANAAYLEAKRTVHLFANPDASIMEAAKHEKQEIDFISLTEGNLKQFLTSKVSREDVEAIRNDNRPITEIAADYPIRREQVWRIKTHRAWTK